MTFVNASISSRAISAELEMRRRSCPNYITFTTRTIDDGDNDWDPVEKLIELIKKPRTNFDSLTSVILCGCFSVLFITFLKFPLDVGLTEFILFITDSIISFVIGTVFFSVMGLVTLSFWPWELAVACTFVLMILETIVENNKSLVITCTSVILVFTTNSSHVRTNLIITFSISFVRIYASAKLTAISRPFRPYCVYIWMILGHIVAYNLHKLYLNDKKYLLSSRKISWLFDMQKQVALKMPAQKQVLYALMKPSKSMFSLTASPTGLPIFLPNTTQPRMLDMKVKSFYSSNDVRAEEQKMPLSVQSSFDFERNEETFHTQYQENDSEKVFSNHGEIERQDLFKGERKTTPNSLPFDERYLKAILPLTETISWSFDIFKFARMSGSNMFSMLAYRIFDQVGLIEAFNIPLEEFFNYMHALQQGYHANPYHNSLHAADVLHTCFYLTTSVVPGLMQMRALDIRNSRMHFDTIDKHKSDDPNLGSCIGANISPLEVLALYISALMHDFNHFGRTNAFLIGQKHELAVLYNDRSVLENHHAAQSWKLLYSDKKYDFLKHLDSKERLRLRFISIELILATDLVKHHDIISDFVHRTEVQKNSPCRVDWCQPDERLNVSKIIIKIADVCTPCKPWNLYLKWSRKVQDEFYLQGDEERRLGIPITKFMDRRNPEEIELQHCFIQNVTMPIVEAFHKANLLTGKPISEGERNTASDSAAEGTRHNPSRTKFYFEIAENLRAHNTVWVDKLKKDEKLLPSCNY